MHRILLWEHSFGTDCLLPQVFCAMDCDRILSMRWTNIYIFHDIFVDILKIWPWIVRSFMAGRGLCFLWINLLRIDCVVAVFDMSTTDLSIQFNGKTYFLEEIHFQVFVCRKDLLAWVIVLKQNRLVHQKLKKKETSAVNNAQVICWILSSVELYFALILGPMLLT